jgi:hypothetical protein
MITYHPDEGMIAKRSAGRPAFSLSNDKTYDKELNQRYEDCKMHDGQRLLLIFMFATDEKLRLAVIVYRC